MLKHSQMKDLVPLLRFRLGDIREEKYSFEYLDGMLQFAAVKIDPYELDNAVAYKAVLIQTALVDALHAKALEERGREISLSDNGVSFTPAGVSETLMIQAERELNQLANLIKLVR